MHIQPALILANLRGKDLRRFHHAQIFYTAEGAGIGIGPYIATYIDQFPLVMRALRWKHTHIRYTKWNWIVTRVNP